MDRRARLQNALALMLVAVSASICTVLAMFAAARTFNLSAISLPTSPPPTATIFMTRTPVATSSPAPVLEDSFAVTLDPLIPTETLAPQVTLDPYAADFPPLNLIGDLPPAGDVPEVALEVDLRHAQQWARVTQRVSLKNTARIAWKDVVFAIPIADRDGAFYLDLARVNGQEVPARLDGIMLHVPLPDPVGPSRRVEISFEFRVAVSGVSEETSFPVGNNGVSGGVMRLSEWFPVVVPYDNGVGWRTWRYQPVGDPTVYSAQNVTLAVHADRNVTVVSGGLVEHSGLVWRFRVEGARGVPIFASSDYHLLDSRPGDFPIRGYYLGDDPHAMERAIEHAANAIKLYEPIYGPYPYQDLTIAQNGYRGDMEFSGLVSISSRAFRLQDGEPTNLLAILIAHEVAHQWWYGAVGSDQTREPWLDESLAAYSELLYYDAYLPGGSARRYGVYASRAQPMMLDASIYDFLDTNEYVEGLYPRGVLFLRELNALIGDDAFFAFLRDYRSHYAGKLATAAGFFAILRQHTSADVKPLIQQYFANVNY